MIDRSVILRYVGFPFYGKEGVSIYTTPALEIILVSSDALETVFINAAPAPEVIQIVVDFFPATVTFIILLLEKFLFVLYWI